MKYATSIFDESFEVTPEHGLSIFTDGSGRSGKYGSAVYIPLLKLLVNKSGDGTNNIGELEGIRYALRFLKTNYKVLKKYIKDESIYIVTDSQYAIKAVTGENKAVANKDLIERCQYYLNCLQKMSLKVFFVHVYSHTSKKTFMYNGNRLVDKFAIKAAREGSPEVWTKQSTF